MKRIALAAIVALLLCAASEPALSPDQETEHVVKSGETLGGIASRAKVPRVLIIEANRLEAPYALRAGQKISIPRTRQHTVARGDTSFTISYLYGVPWKDIAVANGIEPAAAIEPGQHLLIPTLLAKPAETSAAPAASASASATAQVNLAWPASGRVRRGFTARGRASDYHDGIDITLHDGTAVRSAAAGKVQFAGDEPRQFGKLVVIDHGEGWQTAYAFLSRITVKAGDDVSAGERLGLSGHTGQARGPELHFEVRHDNRPVDPVSRLPRQQP